MAYRSRWLELSDAIYGETQDQPETERFSDMANPVNGRVHLTAQLNTGSDAAWKKAREEIEAKVTEALSAVEIRGVTITDARLDFVQATQIIGGGSDGEAPDGDGTENGDVEEPDNDDDAPAEEPSEEKPKKSKKDKAAKGKKKGRK